MHAWLRTLLLVSSLGGIASHALAGITVLLPLEGYYRPGKYMPVRIVMTGGTGPVFLKARGAVTTEMIVGGNGDVTVPWLIVSESPTDARWGSGVNAIQPIQPLLRALGEDEKLVAVIGTEPQAAQALFPGTRVIPIVPDTSHGLLDPPQAWQSVDGVVLGAAAAARLTSAEIGMLLAGGTTIAVASTDKPDSQWPWTHTGGLWVLRPVMDAATFAVNPEAYTPTYDWDRGWPAPFRARIVFVGALFCILATAVALWRSRRAIGGFVAMCVVAVGLVGWWSARRSLVLEKSVETSVRAGGLMQYERWSFRSPLRPAPFVVAASGPGLIGPVFASARQLNDINLQLECGADGKPSELRAQLERGQSMAFLRRIVRPQASPAEKIR